MSNPLIVHLYFQQPLDEKFVKQVLEKIFSCGGSYSIENNQRDTKGGSFKVKVSSPMKRCTTVEIVSQVAKSKEGMVELNASDEKYGLTNLWFSEKRVGNQTVSLIRFNFLLNGFQTEKNIRWVFFLLKSFSSMNPLYGFYSSESGIEQIDDSDEFYEKILNGTISQWFSINLFGRPFQKNAYTIDKNKFNIETIGQTTIATEKKAI